MKNLLLLLASTLLGILLVEAGLRLFTPFPVNLGSNKTYDPLVGYRLSRDLYEIDEHGFRNAKGKNYLIAAVGDSHTYSSNVPASRSWPSVLESMTGVGVYNFGIGSYGIFSYHAIIKTLLRPDTRAVIVGLYPANDFSVNGSYCQIDLENEPFWKAEISALDLQLPPSTECAEQDLPENAEPPGVKDWLSANSALVSAVEILVVSRIRNALKRGNTRDLSPARLARVAGKRTGVDLAVPQVRLMHDNLDRFVAEWARLSRETRLQIGILLIPSVERVVYEYYRQDGMLDRIDPDFVRDTGMQVEIEKRTIALLEKHGVPYRNALSRVVPAFRHAQQEGREFYPDGHPLEEGYRAYAEAAYELWGEMNSRTR